VWCWVEFHRNLTRENMFFSPVTYLTYRISCYATHALTISIRDYKVNALPTELRRHFIIFTIMETYNFNLVVKFIL